MAQVLLVSMQKPQEQSAMTVSRIKLFILALVSTLALPAAGLAATQGLEGEYYEFPQWAWNISQAQSMIASYGPPTATFTANTICFPSCGSTAVDGATTLDAFLGANASDISANSVTDLTGHAIVLTGEIDIASSGENTFSTSSDDGSDLWIDGSLVVNNDGGHPFEEVSSTVSLSAGWHSVEIVQLEISDVTGLTVDLNGAPLSGAEIEASEAPMPNLASTPLGALVLSGGLVVAFGRRPARDGDTAGAPSDRDACSQRRRPYRHSA